MKIIPNLSLLGIAIWKAFKKEKNVLSLEKDINEEKESFSYLEIIGTVE